MAGRTKRTIDQQIAEAERKLQLKKTKKKNMERAKRTRQLILHGEALVARAAAGDVDAKREVDKTLAGLTRDHDRAAFDLEPLPEPAPDNQPTGNASSADLLAAALARRSRAVDAWNADRSDGNRAALGQAVADWERLSGVCWPGLPERAGYGLGDGPGELLA
jgi:hypothetical protein